MSAVAFALTVPDSWFELDVRPATRDARIATLVQERVRDVPELFERRTELTRLLRRQARAAWDAGAVYCACFAMVVDDALIPGSLTVSIIPPPPSGSSPDDVAELLAVRDGDDGTWQHRSVVDLDGIGRVARSAGVVDVDLPGGEGRLRTILMQTFVPVDAERMLLVAAASPAIDLAEPLLELFDVVTGTLALVEGAPANG